MMGNPERAYERQIMLSLFDKEATYDAGPAGWLAANACSMFDFDEAVQDQWPDTVGCNEGEISGGETPSRIITVRQDVKIPYAESRAKPNSIAGLIALNLGTVAAAVQDAALAAYRHKFSKAAPYSLPSIGAQVLHEGGRQYAYKGIKGAGYTLARNGDYIRLDTPLVGSGTRATAVDAFVASISEDPLLWNDAKIYVKATSGTPITVPTTPSQTAANLGGSEVNLSTRVLDFSHTWENALDEAEAYRAGGSKVKGTLKAVRRSGSVKLSVEVDASTEATELDYFLNQSKLALELNVNSNTVVAATGAFKFGLILLIPQLQFTLNKAAKNSYETFELDGKIMDDGTNSEVVLFVYTAQAAYLA